MIKADDITTLEIAGQYKSAIRIGEKDDSLPAHIFQGGKKEGIIVENGIPRPFIWESITFDNNLRYVYFEHMEIYSLEEMARSKRHLALEIVRNIAIGLANADQSFLNLETGIFPLYRIFLLKGSSVLLLPPDIGDVISILRSDDERMSEVNVLIRRDSEQQFKLIMEMAELLYYAASGRLPYQDQDIRHYRYEEYPLESILETTGEELDEKTLGFINFILHAKRREMRDIMGNRSSGKALGWFIEKSRPLAWDLEASDEDIAEKYEGTGEYLKFSRKSTEGAKRHNFFRRRGTVIAVCIVCAVLLGAFLYDYISALLEPPATAGMDQESVIEAFYDAQSSLNPTALMDAVKGADIPQENEVTNLFVTTRVRLAYESSDPLINAQQWVEEGMPDIPASSIVYGAVLNRIEQVDENTLRAYSTWYTPYTRDEDEDTPVIENEIVVHTYDVVQDFTFAWNDRGWWNIIDAPIISSEPGETVSAGIKAAE